MPRAPQSPSNVAVLSSVYSKFAPKVLRFEHVGAKLVSYPRYHLTSVRPCTSDVLTLDLFFLKKFMMSDILATNLVLTELLFLYFTFPLLLG